MKKSKKGKLNLRDFLRGAFFSSSGPLITFAGILSSGKVPSKEQAMFALCSFSGVFIVYVLKHIPEGEK